MKRESLPTKKIEISYLAFLPLTADNWLRAHLSCNSHHFCKKWVVLQIWRTYCSWWSFSDTYQSISDFKLVCILRAYVALLGGLWFNLIVCLWLLWPAFWQIAFFWPMSIVNLCHVNWKPILHKSLFNAEGRFSNFGGTCVSGSCSRQWHCIGKGSPPKSSLQWVLPQNIFSSLPSHLLQLQKDKCSGGLDLEVQLQTSKSSPYCVSAQNIFSSLPSHLTWFNLIPDQRYPKRKCHDCEICPDQRYCSKKPSKSSFKKSSLQCFSSMEGGE